MAFFSVTIPCNHACVRVDKEGLSTLTDVLWVFLVCGFGGTFCLVFLMSVV